MKNTSISPFLIFVSLLLCFFIVSCKGTKRGTTGSLKKRSAGYLVKKINQSRVEADWLDAKAKIDFDSDDFSIGATAYIRMKKDSAIWVVGKKFGIEGIRAFITKDSVFLINRLENSYMAKDISYLQKQFNLPMELNDLQDILLGNAVLLPDASVLKSAKDTTHYLLTELDNKSLTKSYVINASHFYPEEMYFRQGSDNRTANLEFGDHRSLSGADFFSYFRALQFRSPETGEVSLDIKFSKVELNKPKSLSFEIPSHYTKVD